MIATSLLHEYAAWFVGNVEDYALQTDEGRYYRVGSPLTWEVLQAHLNGQVTVGTYLLSPDDTCRFAVFDDDSAHGLLRLRALADELARVGIRSCVESSRRGGHLWVPLVEPVPAWAVRAWLLPFCPPGVEFYPKQATRGTGVGALIRLPLGVHRLSGQRYPFVSWQATQMVTIPLDLPTVLAWLEANGANAAPDLAALSLGNETFNGGADTHHTLHPASPSSHSSGTAIRFHTIQDWCRAHDPLAVIGRYVELNARGMGCCPFGWHHAAGVDRHPSLWVYRPHGHDLCCWYCHTWGRGGSLFDFFRYYYGLDARSLWACLLAGHRV